MSEIHLVPRVTSSPKIVEISPTNAIARTGRALEVRKATLASILRQSRHGVRLNEHLERHEGNVVFAHACKWDWRGLSLSACG